VASEPRTEGTAQSRGYDWDRELARRIGGRAHVGSGNRPYQKLDAGSGLWIVSGKHTDAASFRLTSDMVHETTRAVLGPESMSGGYLSALAIHMGLDMRGPGILIMDLDQGIEWMRQPPNILPSTADADRRATTRVPPFMRGS
jgi:hypothetical protein